MLKKLIFTLGGTTIIFCILIGIYEKTDITAFQNLAEMTILLQVWKTLDSIFRVYVVH